MTYYAWGPLPKPVDPWRGTLYGFGARYDNIKFGWFSCQPPRQRDTVLT